VFFFLNFNLNLNFTSIRKRSDQQESTTKRVATNTRSVKTAPPQITKKSPINHDLIKPPPNKINTLHKSQPQLNNKTAKSQSTLKSSTSNYVITLNQD